MSFKSGWYLMSEKKPSLELFKEKLLTFERGLRGHEARAEHEWTHAASDRDDALRVVGKKKNKSGRSDGFRGKCWRCGEPGHSKYDCPELDQEQGRRKEEAKTVTRNKSGIACALTTVLTFPGRDMIVCDSGASRHLTGHRSWFKSLVPLPVPIKLRTTTGCITATHAGDVDVMVLKDGKHWIKSVWSDVLFVPGIKFNLYSTVYMSRHEGCSFWHEGQKACVTKGGEVVCTGHWSNGSYLMDMLVSTRGLGKGLVQSLVRGHDSRLAPGGKAPVQRKRMSTRRVTGRSIACVPDSGAGDQEAGCIGSIHGKAHDLEQVVACHHVGSRVSERKTRESGHDSVNLKPVMRMVAADRRHVPSLADGCENRYPRSSAEEERTRSPHVRSLVSHRALVKQPVDVMPDEDSRTGCCCSSRRQRTTGPAVRQRRKRKKKEEEEDSSPDFMDLFSFTGLDS
jgi:hypothetical protein